MLASSKPIHCFSPLSRKLDVGWPRIEDFQLRGHSCVNNVQRCLCHFYTWMRHSKQTATLLLTKHHANFDTSTSAKGYARVCTNCACAIVVLGILLAQARPTMPCIHLVNIYFELSGYLPCIICIIGSGFCFCTLNCPDFHLPLCVRAERVNILAQSGHAHNRPLSIVT